jgi:predicted Zn-dependent peptidase
VTVQLPADQPVGSTRTLLRGTDGGGLVRRTVLPGGLRVITEAMPTVRSVSFGVWVGVGSRDETPSLAGATHYLEHLLFKGTKRRDALEIAAALDAVGGEMNAFTAKEYTCYYARVLDDDLPLAVDVICDMVTSSLIAGADVDSERGVILEEIAMHDDEPGDAVHDVFAETVFGDSPLGRPVLGSVESIEALSRQSIAGYYRRRYRPSSLVISAAGNIDHTSVVRLVRRAFEQAGALGAADERPAPARLARAARSSRSRRRRVCVVARPTEQANLVLGGWGVARTDDRRFALGVLNNALGGGMSSRLFQEIREKRGLAYSVYSYASQYAETGLFGVYVGCMPKKIDQVLDLCRTELAAVGDGGISEEELARGKGQMRGSLVLGLEDTGSRMSRLGKSELVYGELMSVDEILRHIDAVTPDDVRAVARDIVAAGTSSLAVIGPFEHDQFVDAVA